MTTREKTLFITRFGVLLGIEALFCFTPLGSLPAIGPIVATLAMVPVIVTAVTMGTWAGTLMGFFGGLFSFLVWTFTPPNPMVAFVFTPFYSFGPFQGNFFSLLICFVPRILAGTVPGLLCKALRGKNDLLCFGLAGFAGSMTNTLLVMGGIGLFFGGQYQQVLGSAILAVIGLTVLTSGIPEAIIGAAAAFGLGKVMARGKSKSRA